MGVPPSVGRAFTASPAGAGDLPWLAATFSVVGLRALADRHLSTSDLSTLHRLAERNLSTLRGYVSKTRLQVREIDWLMDRDVSCQATLTWTRRLPPAHAHTNLVEVLRTATILHRVPDAQVAGWVRYANRHEVVFPGNRVYPWAFLGGDTALMAAAGLSPREADRMARTGRVDRPALGLLASLRAPTSGSPR